MAADSRRPELIRHLVDVVPVDVLEWRTGSGIPEPPSIEGGRLHVLSPDDLGMLDVLPPAFIKAAKTNLKRGDSAYVATVGDRFAGWLWLSRVTHRDPWTGLHLRLAPDEAYLYALWAEPQYRKPGVGAWLISTQLSDLEREGDVSRVYGLVDEPNREMMVLIQIVFGFELVQRVRRARILHLLGWQLPRTDEPKFGPVSRAGRHSTGSRAG